MNDILKLDNKIKHSLKDTELVPEEYNLLLSRQNHQLLLGMPMINFTGIYRNFQCYVADEYLFMNDITLKKGSFIFLKENGYLFIPKKVFKNDLEQIRIDNGLNTIGETYDFVTNHYNFYLTSIDDWKEVTEQYKKWKDKENVSKL